MMTHSEFEAVGRLLKQRQRLEEGKRKGFIYSFQTVWIPEAKDTAFGINCCAIMNKAADDAKRRAAAALENQANTLIALIDRKLASMGVVPTVMKETPYV